MEMPLPVELRYLLPPFFNFIIFLLMPTSQLNIVLIIFQLDEYPFLKLPFLLLAILMLFLFLFTSITINLRFTFTAHPIPVCFSFTIDRPITVRSGYFSGAVTLSLLASIFLPPPLFWVAFFIIIISSPCHVMLWNLFKYVFDWFVIILRSTSTLFITCSTQQQDNNIEAIPAPELPHEFVDIGAEGNTLQN